MQPMLEIEKARYETVKMNAAANNKHQYAGNNKQESKDQKAPASSNISLAAMKIRSKIKKWRQNSSSQTYVPTVNIDKDG